MEIPLRPGRIGISERIFSIFHFPSINFPSYRRFESTETEIEIVLIEHGARENERIFTSEFRAPRNLWSTWIGEPEHTRHLIKCFTDCVVSRLTEHFVFAFARHQNELRVSTRNE